FPRAGRGRGDTRVVVAHGTQTTKDAVAVGTRAPTPSTVILSRSGAGPLLLNTRRVFAPALSWTVTVTVPGVLQLPVLVKLTVTAAAPFTLSCAVRVVAPLT